MIVGIYNISPIVAGGVVPSKSQCNRRFILNTDNFSSTFDGVDENSEVFQEYLDETILTCLDKYGYIRGTYTFQTAELIQCYPLECEYVLKSDRQKYFEGDNLMDNEQEEELDVAMDNDEVGDPEEPLLLLPKFWSQEEKDGVENMLANKDESLRRLVQRLVETWSGWPGYGICTKGHMTINKAGRDQYGTFTFEVCGGFNYSLSRNAPYYFSQLGTMMMFAKNWGVKVWPIKMKFDVADDLWTAEFGIDFNFDDNIAFVRNGAKEIGCIELEEVESGR